VIDLGQGCDFFSGGSIRCCRPSSSGYIDQLFDDENVGVSDRIQHLAHSQRRGSVLADDAEAFLQFGSDRILQSE
jgi:hypothetical protein